MFLWGNLLAKDFDPLVRTKANKAKDQAEKAFEAKDYANAIKYYTYLLDTLKMKDEKALLNLGHAYMRNADYEKASNTYTLSTASTNNILKSIAFQQLGILKSEKGEREAAITNFKNALRSNPQNMEARYNYELLLKSNKKEMPKPQDQKDRKEQEKKNEQKKEQQKKEEQKKQGENKDQEKEKGGDKSEEENKGGKKEDQKGEKDLKEKEKKDEKGDQEKDEKKGNKEENKEGDKKPKDQEGEDKPKDEEGKPTENKAKQEKPDENGEKKGESDQPSDKGEKKDKAPSKSIAVNKEQLKQMNMTEQQAKSLLNAMRQQEVQYIQQIRKVPSKQGKPGEKDW
jgi:hypothetical protein